ncbi:MAG: hypothetical protein IT159_11710 [Bryobacterales bacterium]|nr:hypothetical protein [Bryobacterales bacterium]
MRTWWIAVLAAALAPAAWTADADLSEARIEEIIGKFAAKETEFTRARANYTYRQSARLEELDEFGNVRGRWEMVSDIVFPAGKRTEKVVRAPVGTLRNIIMTPQDEQDLRDVQPFVMTTTELPDYLVRYLGKQNADEIPCFVFAVKPKRMEEGRRYFSGMIWVDDRDLQIVKTYGRGVGLLKKNSDNQFPKFETYREQIDGKYWFPIYTRADDVLHFQSGLSQRIRMTVRYQDYKQFRSEVQIKYEEPVESNETKKP